MSKRYRRTCLTWLRWGYGASVLWLMEERSYTGDSGQTFTAPPTHRRRMAVVRVMGNQFAPMLERVREDEPRWEAAVFAPSDGQAVAVRKGVTEAEAKAWAWAVVSMGMQS